MRIEQYKVVLASASPRRQELLSRIGIRYTVHPSSKEEMVTETQPGRVVEQLARLKAADIFDMEAKVVDAESKALDAEAKAFDGAAVSAAEAALPPLLVIGADTVVCLDGRILGKPADEETAIQMLKQLQGRAHQVYTGVCVIWQEGPAKARQEFAFHVCTEVRFYPMSEEEIIAYVQTKDPLDKAGAYGIQGRCAAHIAGIRGDYNNVVGLPVGELYQQLKKYQLL